MADIIFTSTLIDWSVASGDGRCVSCWHGGQPVSRSLHDRPWHCQSTCSPLQGQSTCSSLLGSKIVVVQLREEAKQGQFCFSSSRHNLITCTSTCSVSVILGRFFPVSECVAFCYAASLSCCHVTATMTSWSRCSAFTFTSCRAASRNSFRRTPSPVSELSSKTYVASTPTDKNF